MKISKLVLAALVMSFISLATPAFGDTTYTYQGNPLTFEPEFDYGGNPNVCDGGTSLCTITGTFSVATPLTDNMALTSITPDSFSFTDGNQTIDNSNGSLPFFEVGTDSNGTIDAWAMEVAIGNNIVLTEDHSGFAEDMSQFVGSYNVSNSSNPGTWTDPPSNTPEPSSLLLLSSGLVGLGFMKRKVFHS